MRFSLGWGPAQQGLSPRRVVARSAQMLQGKATSPAQLEERCHEAPDRVVL